MPHAEAQRLSHQPLGLDDRGFFKNLVARLIERLSRRHLFNPHGGLPVAHLENLRFLIRGQPDAPRGEQIRMRHPVPFPRTGRRPERILFLRVRDPFLLRHPLNLRGAPRKFLNDTARNAGDFPALPRPLNAVAERHQFVRETGMEDGLAVGRIFLDVAEVRRLPAILHRVVCRVEGEAVNVQMRVRDAADRPRREMDELRPGEIPRHPVFLRTAFSHPRGRLLFRLVHRFRDRRTERLKEFFISRQRVKDGETFRRMEIQIVAHGAPAFGPQRQPFTRLRMPIFDQRGEGVRRHVSRQAEKSRGLAVPFSDDLLTFRIVVLAAQPLRIILEGRSSRFGGDHPQHFSMIPDRPGDCHPSVPNSYAWGKTCRIAAAPEPPFGLAGMPDCRLAGRTESGLAGGVAVLRFGRVAVRPD